MTTAKRSLLAFLMAGAAVATIVPLYMGWRGDQFVFFLALQAVPYLIAAAIFLPQRSSRALALGRIVASGLVVMACGQLLVGPAGRGGDMAGQLVVVPVAYASIGIVLVALGGFIFGWLGRSDPD
jgi:hypothetical protein